MLKHVRKNLVVGMALRETKGKDLCITVYMNLDEPRLLGERLVIIKYFAKLMGKHSRRDSISTSWMFPYESGELLLMINKQNPNL